MDHDDEELHRSAYPLIRVTQNERDYSQDRLLQQGSSIYQSPYDAPEAPSRFKSLHRTRRSSASSLYSSQNINEADVSATRDDFLYPTNQPDHAFPPPHETAYQGRTGYMPVAGAAKLWRPWWLNKIILICFVLLFAALVTALLLVWYSSVEQDGFYVPASTSHYTWTYGPTAVLVVVISLWRQVDYQCKSLTPWAELRNGPVTASRSLLLDYVSPLQLVTLFKAVTNGHLAVVATVAVFILLKLITIFSTGLFVLGTVMNFDTSFIINTTTKFDTSLAAQFNSTSGLEPSTISNAPVYAYYGNVAHGLPLKPGLNQDYAYPTFEAAGNVPLNASLTAQIDAFVPSANCRIIDVQIDGPKTINGLNKTHAFGRVLSLILPDGDICMHWSDTEVPVQDPQYDPCPPQQVTGTTQNVYCSTSNNFSKVDFSKGPDGVLYTLTSMSYKQHLFANYSSIDSGSTIISYVNSTSRTVKSMVNLICQPSYTITRVNATNSTAAPSGSSMDQTRITQLTGAKNRTLSGFSAQNLSSVFQATVDASEFLFGTPDNTNLITTVPQRSNTMWSLLAFVHNTNNYSVLFDGAKLQSAVESTFKGISLQFAQQSLLGPDQTAITGGAIYPQKRLHVRETSLWVMTACFGIIILFAILVLFLAPSAVVSRDPNSTASLATILARSPDLNRELREKGATQARLQSAILSPHLYRASVGASETGVPVFRIQIQRGDRPHGTPTTVSSQKLRFWRPLTLSYPATMLTIILPIGAIVALELLQRDSDRNNGLLDLPNDHFSEAYIHYIPALVMLIIAAMFSSLDFNVSTFTPFSALKHGNAKSRRSLMSHFLGKSPPFAMFEALRTWHLGALLSTFAALVASALTVIVSGLFSVQMLSSAGPTRSLLKSDSFNLTWNNSFAKDNGAAATLSLIEHMNLSYPDFTYGEYAFPKFSLGDLQTQPQSISIISGPVSAVIPAARANLDCTILPESSYTVSTIQSGPYTEYGADVAQVNAQHSLPEECQRGGYPADKGFFNYTSTFFLIPKNEGVFAGGQLDLSFGNETFGVNYGEAYGNITPDNPPGCPSLAFTFGYFKLNSTDKTNVTTMICYQQFQQVSTNVTLLANSTQIDTSIPPVPNESTVQLLTNPRSSTDDTTFQFRLQDSLINEMASFNGSGYMAHTGDGNLDVTGTIDIFYQAVINGSEKTSPQDLVGPANQQRFLNATNHFYRKYLAQAANANMRQKCPASGCSSTSVITARQSSSDLLATTTIFTPRLVQSATSKLVLQILLGVMTLCGTLAYILTPMHNLLPCNPCTIAGGMALLAGSRLCWSNEEAVCECCGKFRPRGDGEVGVGGDNMIHAVGEVDDDVQAGHEEQEELIPPGAEWMSDKKLRKLPVFAPRARFAMGWWRAGYGGNHQGQSQLQTAKRFGIDVGGRANGLDDQDWSLGKRARQRPVDDLEFDAGPEQRRSLTPSWILANPNPREGGVRQGHARGQIQGQRRSERTVSEQLSRHDIRQSRLPSWMLGPLRPEREREQREEGEQDLAARGPSPRPAGLGLVEKDEDEQQRPPRDSGRLSRMPQWLLGPLKPDPDAVVGDTAKRGEYRLAGQGRGVGSPVLPPPAPPGRAM